MRDVFEGLDQAHGLARHVRGGLCMTTATEALAVMSAGSASAVRPLQTAVAVNGSTDSAQPAVERDETVEAGESGEREAADQAGDRLTDSPWTSLQTMGLVSKASGSETGPSSSGATFTATLDSAVPEPPVVDIDVNDLHAADLGPITPDNVVKGDDSAAPDLPVSVAVALTPQEPPALADFVESLHGAVVTVHAIDTDRGDTVAPSDDATGAQRQTRCLKGVVVSSGGQIVTTLTGMSHATRFRVETKDGQAFSAVLAAYDASTRLALLDVTDDTAGLSAVDLPHESVVLVDRLRRIGVPPRNFLGVRVQAVTDDIAGSVDFGYPGGALVVNVTDKSPAAEAGVQQGDIIRLIDGEQIGDAQAFLHRLGACDPEADHQLTVWRNGMDLDIRVRVGLLTEDAPLTAPEPPKETGAEDQGIPQGAQKILDWGLTLQASDDGEGVIIADVRPGSAAARKGLRSGERLLKIADRAVVHPKDAQTAVDTALHQEAKAVLVLVSPGAEARDDNGDDRDLSISHEPGAQCDHRFVGLRLTD